MAKEDMAVKKTKKNKKRQDITPIIIVGTLAVVLVIILVLTQMKPKVTVTIPDKQKAAITDGLTMGDPNAKVKVVEFADFQCPYCGMYVLQLEPTIIQNYVDTGKVFFTYSPFSFLGSYGSDPSWDESKKSAEAAYCANDQGYFWEYRDVIYANQNGENNGVFVRDTLVAYAKTLGLDKNAFEECLDSGKYTQAVEDANTYAAEQGVEYSPAFIVNGTIVGSSELEQAIQDALNK